MISRPTSVFVPFEWWRGSWLKRDDLPRFKEPQEAAQYLIDTPAVSFRNGRPVLLQWQERTESVLIEEYVRGVGTPEYLSLKH